MHFQPSEFAEFSTLALHLPLKTCQFSYSDFVFFLGSFKLFRKKENMTRGPSKVLRRSPDLFNYVEIGEGQLQLIKKHISVLPYMGIAAILVK